MGSLRKAKLDYNKGLGHAHVAHREGFIIAPCVHVLRHLKKDFLIPLLNLSRSNPSDALTNIATIVWTRFYVILKFRKFANLRLIVINYNWLHVVWHMRDLHYS